MMEEHILAYCCLSMAIIGCLSLFLIAEHITFGTAKDSSIKKASLQGRIVEIRNGNTSTTLTIAHEVHTPVTIFDAIDVGLQKNSQVSIEGEWMDDKTTISAERVSVLRIGKKER